MPPRIIQQMENVNEKIRQHYPQLDIRSIWAFTCVKSYDKGTACIQDEKSEMGPQSGICLNLTKNRKTNYNKLIRSLTTIQHATLPSHTIIVA